MKPVHRKIHQRLPFTELMKTFKDAVIQFTTLYTSGEYIKNKIPANIWDFGDVVSIQIESEFDEKS